MFEVGLVQGNLADNQYQRNSKLLYISTSNKCYTYLLNVEASNFILLKTYNTEFDDIIVTFKDQNDRPFNI